MEKIKRALKICYVIQAIIILMLVINRAFVFLGATALNVTVWHMPIVFLPNFIGCGMFFLNTLRQNLKDIAPEAYEELFKDYPMFNSLRSIDFIYLRGEDAESVRKIKAYMKHFYVICGLILFEAILIMVIYT